MRRGAIEILLALVVGLPLGFAATWYFMPGGSGTRSANAPLTISQSCRSSEEVIRRQLKGPFTSAGGKAWTAAVPDLVVQASTAASPTKSRLVLCENGRALETGNAQHDHIRNDGNGRYSHWGTALYFSTSDGSDPNTNGRDYVAVVPRS